ncbi:hypothetical protein IMSHALPRED_003052 [Imshaugia aleurites]|uniref:Uncharacterized protein n=1 Tax=Imshaugia aleurites TaxID=172621 RepID=A0A8H3F1H6_9LECA|nr:hypothetical protein IMSHALPRED_003052 [Imshaugia aleurites]
MAAHPKKWTPSASGWLTMVMVPKSDAQPDVDNCDGFMWCKTVSRDDRKNHLDLWACTEPDLVCENPIKNLIENPIGNPIENPIENPIDRKVRKCPWHDDMMHRVEEGNGRKAVDEKKRKKDDKKERPKSHWEQLKWQGFGRARSGKR